MMSYNIITLNLIVFFNLKNSCERWLMAVRRSRFQIKNDRNILNILIKKYLLMRLMNMF